MTLNDFYYWLEGYLASGSVHIKTIQAKMQEVELESPKKTQNPTYPYYYPNDWNWTTTTHTYYSECPKCGLKLDKLMSYTCSNPECPTGLSGPTC